MANKYGMVIYQGGHEIFVCVAENEDKLLEERFGTGPKDRKVSDFDRTECEPAEYIEMELRDPRINCYKTKP